MTEAPGRVVGEGDYIILRKERVFKVIQVRRDRKIYVEKAKFSLNGIIGHPYGTTFELQRSTLVKASSKNYDADIDIDEDAGKDNRNVTDDSENQKMTREDLVHLKRSGATGEDIVEQLVVNSATFKEKTEFAQQKYLKKKKKKYVPLYTVLRPCARLLCQMYMSKGPNKICCMRLDSLGQILTYSNTRPGNRMMVVETCLGLVTGAVMERMAGQGTVVQFYNGSAPTKTVLEAFDFPSSYLQNLYTFPLELVSTIREVGGVQTETGGAEPCDTGSDLADTHSSPPLESATAEVDVTEEQDVEQCCSEQADVEMEQVANSSDACIAEANDCVEGPLKYRWSSSLSSSKRTRKPPSEEEKKRRREARLKQLQESREIIQPANMDGLIVATRHHPTPIVMALLDYVLPSRPFVVFSQYKEPLLDCYQTLRDRGSIVCLKLTETWLREYQVLPNRTHPKMQMCGTGGYVLSGMTVEKC